MLVICMNLARMGKYI